MSKRECVIGFFGIVLIALLIFFSWTLRADFLKLFIAVSFVMAGFVSLFIATITEEISQEMKDAIALVITVVVTVVAFACALSLIWSCGIYWIHSVFIYAITHISQK